MQIEMTRQRLRDLVRSSLDDGATSDCGRCEVLRSRSGGRGMLLRIRDDDGASVIAKAFLARSLKERLKGIAGVGMARREWRVHRHLEESGLAVPHLIGNFRVRCADGRRFDVVVVEDLGTTRNGLVHFKQLLERGDEEQVRRFEDDVIELTHELLGAGVVDVDHQLRNIVLNGSARPIRIDFECARTFRSSSPPDQTYGIMVGRLITSHAFGTQPNLDRTSRFATRLADRLGLSRDVRDVASVHVRVALEKQRRVSGVDSRLELMW